MSKEHLDRASDIRSGESIDEQALSKYLLENLNGFQDITSIKQFPKGFSNLTYLLKTNLGEIVLRRPPHGANIKSAHDMHREYKVLDMLYPVFQKVPKPLLYCADESIIGGEFYLMDRVSGTILRQRAPKGFEITSDWIRTLSKATVQQLAALHNLNISDEPFASFGKPEGYVSRQVHGWINRYHKSKTDEIPFVDEIEAWMIANMPKEEFHGLIHNDYKFDNVVIDLEDPGEIKAILDWEMATIGDVLMDFGTSLAYWAEPKDPETLKGFSLTGFEGNYNREEIVALYFEASNLEPKDMTFYFVYGAYKVGVIAQQIYARYKKGLTSDQRFAMLIYLVHACMANAAMAMQKGRISNLY